MFHCTQSHSPQPIIKDLEQHTSCYARRSAEFTYRKFMKDTAEFKKEIEAGKINERFAQDIDNYYQRAAGEFYKRPVQYVMVLNNSYNIW
jgi:hypothetical protein